VLKASFEGPAQETKCSHICRSLMPMQINLLQRTFSDLGKTNTVLPLYNLAQDCEAAEKFLLKIEILYGIFLWLIFL